MHEFLIPGAVDMQIHQVSVDIPLVPGGNPKRTGIYRDSQRNWDSQWESRKKIPLAPGFPIPSRNPSATKRESQTKWESQMKRESQMNCRWESRKIFLLGSQLGSHWESQHNFLWGKYTVDNPTDHGSYTLL